MGKMNVIVKGLQRSGTNYLTAVLEDNFRVKALWSWKDVPGGKHMPHVGGPAKAPVFVSIKDPYAWMYSLFRHSRKKGRGNYSQASNFAAFLRQELRMPTACGAEVFYRPATCWMDMNLSWMAITGRKVVAVKCEKWMNHDDAANWVSVIGKWLPLRVKKPSLRKRVPVNRNFDPTIYTKMKYLDAYTRDDIDYVNGFLDPVSMNRLGYECVSR